MEVGNSSTGLFVTASDLLRSSLVSGHTESRDESWKAWASEAKGAVQAPAVGIIAPGADWAGADKAQNNCPRLEGLVPEFLDTDV